MDEFEDMLKHAVAYDDNQRPVAVEVRERMLIVTLKDSRLIGTPLDWYPKLANATPQQLANVEFSTFALHWEDLDEDLGIEGMLLGIRPNPPQPQEV